MFDKVKEVLLRNAGGGLFDKAQSRMAPASVIHPAKIASDASIGPGIVLPDMPDFPAIAEELCEAIMGYETFHEEGIDFFAPKLEDEAIRYCRGLHRVFEEYESHLNTTYRTALLGELSEVELRLSAMPNALPRVGVAGQGQG